jgi:hypothetical protein
MNGCIYNDGYDSVSETYSPSYRAAAGYTPISPVPNYTPYTGSCNADAASLGISNSTPSYCGVAEFTTVPMCIDVGVYGSEGGTNCGAGGTSEDYYELFSYSNPSNVGSPIINSATGNPYYYGSYANYGQTGPSACAEYPASGDYCTLYYNSGVTATPAPTATITVNGSANATITSGDAANVAWSSTNATSCTITNSAGTTIGSSTSGNSTQYPTSSTTYTISCTGAGGNTSAQANVTVNTPAAPTATITVNGVTNATITNGSSATIAWGSTNATSCSITNIGSSTSGSTTQYPTSYTSYVMTCTGPGGTATSQASVTVTQQYPDLTATYVTGQRYLTGSVGVPVDLNAIISNIGPVSTGVPFTTTFWVNSSQTKTGATTYKFTSGVPGGFPADYSEEDGYQVPITTTFSSPGTYYYRVCANEDQNSTYGVTESDYTNNCFPEWATITITALPDLSATAGDPITGTPGAAQTFISTVTNASGASAAPAGFWNIVQVCDSGVLQSGNCSSYDTVNNADYYNSTVPAGPSSEPLSYAGTLPTTAGSYAYRWCANEKLTGQGSFSQSNVTESNYGNNCSGWATMTVGYPATGGSCTYSPSSTGTNLPVTWTASPTGGSGSYTYSWSGTNLSGTNQNATSQYSTSGTYPGQVTITSGGTQATEICTASGGGGGGSGGVSIVSCTPTLTASPTTVTEGGSTVLSWSVNSLCSNSCTLSNGTSGGSSGSSTVYPPAPASGSTQTYSVTCGDQSNTASVPVTVLVPTASLTPAVSLVANGGTATLTYQCGNSTSGYITPAVNGAISTDGNAHNISTYSVTSQTKYTLTCSVNGYSATASAIVNIPPAFQNF